MQSEKTVRRNVSGMKGRNCSLLMSHTISKSVNLKILKMFSCSEEAFEDVGPLIIFPPLTCIHAWIWKESINPAEHGCFQFFLTKHMSDVNCIR